MESVCILSGENRGSDGPHREDLGGFNLECFPTDVRDRADVSTDVRHRADVSENRGSDGPHREDLGSCHLECFPAALCAVDANDAACATKAAVRLAIM